MTVTIDLVTIFLASIPLGIAIFAAAWILFKVMVATPLTKIGEKLDAIQTVFADHETRLTLLEYKVDED